MRFKMTTARLLASSYGSSFTPSNDTLPHVLASNFQSGSSSNYQQLLTSALFTWPTEKEFGTAIAAMNYARINLGKYLSEYLDVTMTFVEADPTYTPVESSGGDLVGIEGNVWMQRNGSQVQATISTPSLTLLACVFVSLQRIS